MTPRLSPRQREAIDSYSRLGSAKLVAHAMGVSEFTVREHLREARRRLGVETTVQAVRIVLLMERPAA